MTRSKNPELVKMFQHSTPNSTTVKSFQVDQLNYHEKFKLFWLRLFSDRFFSKNKKLIKKNKKTHYCQKFWQMEKKGESLHVTKINFRICDIKLHFEEIYFQSVKKLSFPRTSEISHRGGNDLKIILNSQFKNKNDIECVSVNLWIYFFSNTRGKFSV